MPTFDTPQPISATIEPVVGNVRIIASDRADTVVEVRPTDESNASDVKAAEQTRVDYSAGTLTVKAPRMRALDFSNKTRSVDVTVELPTGSRVQGSTGVGDLHGTGRLGSCRYKSGAGHVHLDGTGELNLVTGAGNIGVERVAGKAEISTGSGRVSVDEVDGTAEIKNSNGDTTIGTVTGSARVRSANGDITVAHAADGVDAKTANGSVRAQDVVRGTVVLETAMGGIEIGIREGSAAWLDVKTRFGHVHNTMDATDSPDTAADTVEVRAHTAFGDIAVHRS
jgi:Putative adhesin